MRTPLTTCAFALLFALSACSGGQSDDDDDDPYVPPVQNTQTGDTAVEVGFKQLHEVRFHAFIGWDANLQTVVAPFDQGNQNISAYIITITDVSGNWSEEESECEVIIDLENYVPADDAAPTYTWGLDIPQGTVLAGEDCIDGGWDPADFTDGSPLADWATFDYHVRLGNQPGEDLTDWLTPAAPETDWSIDRYAGGTWWTDTAGISGGDDDIYFYAYGLSADHEIDFDTRVDRFDMIDDQGGLATGYYIMRMSVYWDFSDDT